MTTHNYKYLGKGIYTVAEASRLIHVSPDRIRRWLKGYTYISNTGVKTSKSVIEPDYDVSSKSYALSFLDLLEMRFINSFLEYGVSLKTVRRVAINAANYLHNSHPFINKQFYTDKRTILLKCTENGDSRLIDLANNQVEIDKVFAAYLYHGIEYKEDSLAVRWWPLGDDHSIVIDPKRNFGRPVLNKEGIPTDTIAKLFRAEGSIDSVTDWFDIDRQSVSIAINYEESLAA